MADNNKLHNARQLSEKDRAMDTMFEQMIANHNSGCYQQCRNRFYSDIESLRQLLKEYNQG